MGELDSIAVQPHRGLHDEGRGAHGAPPRRALLVDEVLLRGHGGCGGLNAAAAAAAAPAPAM
jgi:hypothetical protein